VEVHFHDNKIIEINLHLKKKAVLRNMMAEQHGERENGDEFANKLKKFLQDGCGCTLGPKYGSCSRQFSVESTMFRLSLEANPLVKKGEVLVAHFIFNLNQSARKCFCISMA